MKEHELKCRPEYLFRIISGQKRFEIRKNDRDFQVGDFLVLREFDPDNDAYDEIRVKVTYITTYEQKEGYVVMGIELEGDETP